MPNCLYENLTYCPHGAMAHGYHIKLQHQKHTYNRYINEKFQFNSLVWGSHTLAPIMCLLCSACSIYLCVFSCKERAPCSLRRKGGGGILYIITAMLGIQIAIACSLILEECSALWRECEVFAWCISVS